MSGALITDPRDRAFLVPYYAAVLTNPVARLFDRRLARWIWLAVMSTLSLQMVLLGMWPLAVWGVAVVAYMTRFVRRLDRFRSTAERNGIGEGTYRLYVPGPR